MPRFLALVQYSAEGMKGFLKDKAAGREDASRKAAESAGGKQISWYWTASGEYNVVGIGEYPDAATAGALGAVLLSSGAVSKFNVIELLTASEIDRALGKPITFRPPGG
jgi:uncharacterized protein with GYD domain